MLDYAVLPPEVNSARMYAGAGSASLVAAAAAWDRLAGSLASAEQSCRVVLEELTDGSWRGSSAAAMTGAARPYLAWLSGTAVQAAQTAEQARGAVAAYEAAFSATVPPAVIGANRSALAVLVRTNVFGQNTAAIAANQADYHRMWAQDAAAMHSYAASAAAVAPQPGAFTAPPQTTNPAAASQTAPASGGDALANLLNHNPLVDFLQSPLVTGWEQLFNNNVGLFTGTVGAPSFDAAAAILGGPGIPAQGAIAAWQTWSALSAGMPELASSVSGEQQRFTLAGSHPAGPAAAGPSAGARVVPTEVAASRGHAVPVGELSVPPSWTGTGGPVQLAAAASPGAGLTGLPAAGQPGKGHWLGGLPPMVGVVNAPRTGGARLRSRAKAAEANNAEATDAQAAGADADADYRAALIAGVQGALGGRDELNRLRRAVTEMAQQREALERSAASMIEQAVR